MLNTIKYQTIKRDISTAGRITRFENPISNKIIGFPSVLCHLQGKEDIDFLRWYNKKKLPKRNFSGIVVPYDRLFRFGKEILKELPNNWLFLSDIQSEVYFRGSLKEGIWNVIKNSRTVPEQIKKLVTEVKAAILKPDQLSTAVKAGMDSALANTELYVTVSAGEFEKAVLRSSSGKNAGK